MLPPLLSWPSKCSMCLPPLPPKEPNTASPLAHSATQTGPASAAAAAGRLFPARRADAAAAAGQAQHAPAAAAAAARRARRARPGEEALGRRARLLRAQARRQVRRDGLEQRRHAAPVPRAGREHLRARWCLGFTHRTMTHDAGVALLVQPLLCLNIFFHTLSTIEMREYML